MSSVLHSLFPLLTHQVVIGLFWYVTLGGRMTTPQSAVSFVSCYSWLRDLSWEAEAIRGCRRSDQITWPIFSWQGTGCSDSKTYASKIVPLMFPSFFLSFCPHLPAPQHFIFSAPLHSPSRGQTGPAGSCFEMADRSRRPQWHWHSCPERPQQLIEGSGAKAPKSLPWVGRVCGCGSRGRPGSAGRCWPHRLRYTKQACVFQV